jgi:hypothetical protein
MQDWFSDSSTQRVKSVMLVCVVTGRIKATAAATATIATTTAKINMVSCYKSFFAVFCFTPANRNGKDE